MGKVNKSDQCLLNVEKNSTSVARRNARERRRIKNVNSAFDELRQHVPSGDRNRKKISKVDTLQSAIEYIKALEELVRKRCSNGNQATESDKENDITSSKDAYDAFTENAKHHQKSTFSFVDNVPHNVQNAVNEVCSADLNNNVNASSEEASLQTDVFSLREDNSQISHLENAAEPALRAFEVMIRKHGFKSKNLTCCDDSSHQLPVHCETYEYNQCNPMQEDESAVEEMAVSDLLKNMTESTDECSNFQDESLNNFLCDNQNISFLEDMSLSQQRDVFNLSQNRKTESIHSSNSMFSIENVADQCTNDPQMESSNLCKEPLPVTAPSLFGTNLPKQTTLERSNGVLQDVFEDVFRNSPLSTESFDFLPHDINHHSTELLFQQLFSTIPQTKSALRRPDGRCCWTSNEDYSADRRVCID